jgi:hypothetical protein
MVRKTTEPDAGQPGTNQNRVQPLFPTRRAIVGGAVIAGAVWVLSYRPSPDPNWTRLVGKAIWSPRDGAALLLQNDRVWLFGGSPSNEILDLGDVWSTVDGIDWRREVDQAAWTPSANAMSVAFGGRMWRMGGFVKRENRFLPISEIWASADGRNWTLASSKPDWEARGGGALVVHNEKLWLLGGTRHPHNEGDQPLWNDVWSTENGIDWKEITSNAPWKPRAFHSAIAHNDRLWILGGGHWGKSATYYRDVWSSFDGIKWEQHSKQAEWTDQPRGGSSTIWYSADGSKWYPYLAARSWPARMAHCSVVFDGRLWVLAGSNGDYFNDVWTLRVGREDLEGRNLTRAVKWLYTTFGR